MIDRDALRRLCDTEFRARLAALETERRGLSQARWGLWLVALASLIAGFLLSRLGWGLEATAFAWIAVTVPPVYILTQRRKDAGARRQAEFDRLVREVAGQSLPGAVWGAEGSASGVEVRESGIFGPAAQKHESFAGLSGASSVPGLTFAEIRLFSVKEWYDPAHDHSSSGRSTSTNRRKEYDVFRGLYFALDSSAEVHGTTFLDPPRVGAAIASREALEAVAFDDPAFDRAFRVSASDPEEARALLTPSARACFVRLREMADKPVHISISGGRLSVAVEHRRFLFDAGSQVVGVDRVAQIADCFALVELAEAALPAGSAVPRRAEPAPNRGRTEATATVSAASAEADDEVPSRPATSRTRLTRRDGGLSIVYTKAMPPLRLWLSALGLPVLAVAWFFALVAFFQGGPDSSAVLVLMLPIAVGTLVWFYAAQVWWEPVSRVEVADGELRVTRGRLRTLRRPTASIRSLKIRRGVLRADGLSLSPPLAGAEVRWVAYEVGSVLRVPVA